MDDRRVSGMYAQVQSINNQFYLVNMNSTGGTFVDGQKIYQAVLYSATKF
ncbi:MAG: FHA domain-containing protein [Chloroflexi bacterium]|nr:FHA domain-containing protein [Chloroflexota bacterium]